MTSIEKGVFTRQIERIRRAMREHNTDVLVLQHQANVSWLLMGRTHVNVASEEALATIVITDDHLAMVVNNIEAQRLLEEELLEADAVRLLELKVWDWYDPAAKERIIQDFVGDTLKKRVADDTTAKHWIVPLRATMDTEAVGVWRDLGHRTGAALEAAAIAIKPGMSEYQIAGVLAQAAWEREVEPVVNLIAVDERISLRRHPLPTNRKLNTHAMLVLCGRQAGRIVSATRIVHFGKIPDELQRKHQAVTEIDARMMEATQPGRSLGELFDAAKGFYADVGFADEYKLHHQGGMGGYLGREYFAMPDEKAVAANQQTFAWNPSITGTKSEDTLLLLENSKEIITSGDGEFPMLEIKVDGGVFQRPDILIR